MATTEHFYSGTGTQTSFPFQFPYLTESDIFVKLYNSSTGNFDLLQKNTSGLNHDYSISNTNIVFNTAPPQVAGIDNIHIYRTTDVETAKAVYNTGSAIRAQDLNNNTDQALFRLQESYQLITSSYIKDGAITEAKLAPNSVTTVHIRNLTIIDEDISNTAAIQGHKIVPNFGTNIIIGDGSQIINPNPNFGEQTITTQQNITAQGNITTQGNLTVGNDIAVDNITATNDITAARFFGDGSGLTGIDLTGLPYFLRSDVADDCHGAIRFGDNVQFGVEMEKLDGTMTPSTSEVTFHGAHDDNYLKWDPTSVSQSNSIKIGNDVNIGLENNWQLNAGNTTDSTIWRFYQGSFSIHLSPNYGSPTTTGTVANTPKIHNRFKILGHANTNIPTSGSLSNEQFYEWFVLETDPVGLTEMKNAGYANQIMKLRSNDRTILKIHKDGVDLENGNIFIPQRVVSGTGTYVADGLDDTGYVIFGPKPNLSATSPATPMDKNNYLYHVYSTGGSDGDETATTTFQLGSIASSQVPRGIFEIIGNSEHLVTFSKKERVDLTFLHQLTSDILMLRTQILLSVHLSNGVCIHLPELLKHQV